LQTPQTILEVSGCSDVRGSFAYSDLALTTSTAKGLGQQRQDTASVDICEAFYEKTVLALSVQTVVGRRVETCTMTVKTIYIDI
jgi:hypothetical protein